MRNKKWVPSGVLWAVGVALLLEAVSGQCCLSFSGGACVSCPAGMHLFRGNCLYDVAGCAVHEGGFECAACRSNYQLVGGSCLHPRFPASLANATNFTLYLQSALKPDALLEAAQHALQNDPQLWVDWYNHTLQLSQTVLNARSLVRTAQQLMANATADPKIHQILTGTVQRGSDSLLLYRFVYELSLGRGFADCLLTLELANATQNYLELTDVKVKRVDDQPGWTELAPACAQEAYVLARLAKYFPALHNYDYLKGYSRSTEDGANFTMFFMSKEQGIVSFIYLADRDELPAPLPTTTTPPATPTTPAATPTTSTAATTSTTTSTSAAATTSTSTAATTSTSTATPATPANTNSPPAQNSKPEAKEESANQAKNNTIHEVLLNSTNLNSNPIFAAGYAVIMQQYQLPPTCLVDQLFSIPSTPPLYGLYLRDPTEPAYYRIAFTIDLAQALFEIATFTRSLLPLIQPPSTNTTKPDTNAIKIETNTSKAANTTQTPAKAETIEAAPVINSSSSQLCGKSQQEFVDITNKQNSDLFLPKINLLLRTMYESELANTHISAARYTLSFDPAAATTTISYHISYTNTQGTTFTFETAIVNNEFQLISAPNATVTDAQPTPTPPTPTPTLTPTPTPPTPTPTPTQKEEAKGESGKNNKSETVPKETSSDATKTATVEPAPADAAEKSKKNEPNPTSSTANTASEAPKNITPDVSKTDVPRPAVDTSKPTADSSKTSAPDAANPVGDGAKPAEAHSSKPSTNSTVEAPSNSISKANETASPPLPIEIPAKNYTTEPKYKSLVTILRSIYRIPMNASVVAMLLWNDTVPDSRYHVAFRMNYSTPLPDGSVAKLSSYNLSVNPSSFVSVHSEKIEFLKAPDPQPATPATTPTMPPAAAATPSAAVNDTAANKSASEALPSSSAPPATAAAQSGSGPPLSSAVPLALLGAPSPYLKNLYQIFTRHSPVLQQYTLVSLNSSASNTSGAIVSYHEKLQFSRKGEAVCFGAWYEVASLKNGPPATTNQVLLNMLEYHAVDCPSRPAANFSGCSFATEPVNQSVSAQLAGLARGFPLSFSLWQRCQNYYRLRFSSTAFGDREVLLNAASRLVLRFRAASKPLYTQAMKGSLIATTIADALRANMEKIFRLKAGSVALQWVGKGNEDALMLLEIVGRTQIQAQWMQPLYQHFAMRAVFWPTENFIKIVSATALDLAAHQYSLPLPSACLWTQLSPADTFNDPAVSPLLPSLAAAYASFLQNAQIIAVYREAPKQAAGGGRLLVAISKQFSASYQSGYLLTVSLAANQTHIDNIESLPLATLQLPHCTASALLSGLPSCQACAAGFRLKDGFCEPAIPACVEYAEQFCIQCESGLLSKDLLSCVEADEERVMSAAIAADASTAH